jgi:hypothetical protein
MVEKKMAVMAAATPGVPDEAHGFTRRAADDDAQPLNRCSRREDAIER